jgi:hypothetical protein
LDALPRRDIRNHSHGRREIMLQHLVGIDAGLVTAIAIATKRSTSSPTDISLSF